MEGLLGRFLSFDKMMTGSLIKVLYYILLLFVVIGGVFFLLKSLFSGQIGAAVGSLIILPLAIIYIRMMCEMLIVVFRISDNLAAIRKMKETETGTST